MKKIEMHCKTKYSMDKDSTIDIESVIYNAKENGERGIVFVDKDSVASFPKIYKTYNKLCESDNSFKDFKIGYGTELNVIIADKEYQVIILLKNNDALDNIYEIMSLYLGKYNRKLPLDVLSGIKTNCLIGLILNDESLKLDLSIFDYLEINDDIDISCIKDKSKIIYSNKPNSLYEGESHAKEVLYLYRHIMNEPQVRLYKDTEDTLKVFNNKEIVITNSNLLFDKLDYILINDDKFYITNVDTFNEFEQLVKKKFRIVYKNPSAQNITRLDEELKLIKEMNYIYIYEVLLELTNYLKEEKEYYTFDGFINNSLVAYILGITTIEPYNLPYELFFSEIPNISLNLSDTFYYKKMFKFIIDKFSDELLKVSIVFKMNKENIPRIIKHYEIKKKQKFNSSTKDYICNTLNDIPLYSENKFEEFYFVPKDTSILTFTPYTIETINQKSIKGAYFDSHDLSNNLFKINFRLKTNYESISNLIKKTKDRPKLYNDFKVYNLFRNIESFDCKFNILDKETGTLNISYFDDKKMDDMLINSLNIGSENLINILNRMNYGIIKDDLYNGLKQRHLNDLDIFNVINYFKDNNKLLISKGSLLNKVYTAYLEMYYKLYYKHEYYQELLSKIEYQYLDEKVFKYNMDTIKKRYYELNEEIYLSFSESIEFKFLKILIEMYERKIKFTVKDGTIEIGV